MPVTLNFQVSHQWVREIKQWKHGLMMGVYFRVADDERVWMGQYNDVHQEVTVAEASAFVMSQTTMTGVQVIIPRSVEVKDILRVRKLPQVVGWRHYPGSHGRRPFTCKCCQRGGFGSRKIREKLGE